MAKFTVDRIAEIAETSCFYVTPEGLWLRIMYCDMDEGYFQGVDENSYEEYKITFESVAEEENPHFERLVRVEL